MSDDFAGGAAPNVTVVVESLSPASKLKWRTLTNKNGFYNVPLKPGRYRVSVSGADRASAVSECEVRIAKSGETPTFSLFQVTNATSTRLDFNLGHPITSRTLMASLVAFIMLAGVFVSSVSLASADIDHSLVLLVQVAERT